MDLLVFLCQRKYLPHVWRTVHMFFLRLPFGLRRGHLLHCASVHVKVDGSTPVSAHLTFLVFFAFLPYCVVVGAKQPHYQSSLSPKNNQNVENTKTQPGQKVAILGAGPIGLVSMMVARAFGAAELVVTDVSDERLKVAKEVRLERKPKGRVQF